MALQGLLNTRDRIFATSVMGEVKEEDSIPSQGLRHSAKTNYGSALRLLHRGRLCLFTLDASCEIPPASGFILADWQL